MQIFSSETDVKLTEVQVNAEDGGEGNSDDRCRSCSVDKPGSEYITESEMLCYPLLLGKLPLALTQGCVGKLGTTFVSQFQSPVVHLSFLPQK